MTQILQQHIKQLAEALTCPKLSSYLFETLQVPTAVLGWWITDNETKSLTC